MPLPVGRSADFVSASRTIESAAQVREYSEHAAVLVARGRYAQLGQHAGDVALDRALAEDELLADGLVRHALCHELEHLALARSQVGQWVVPVTTNHARHD